MFQELLLILKRRKWAYKEMQSLGHYGGVESQRDFNSRQVSDTLSTHLLLNKCCLKGLRISAMTRSGLFLQFIALASKKVGEYKEYLAQVLASR